MKTATQFLEKSLEDERCEMRVRQILRSSAARAVAEGEAELEGVDEHNYRRVISDIAMRAAYLAIQADRDIYQQEIQYLNKLMGLQLEAIFSRPPPLTADFELVRDGKISY